jgi:hypothetical protein
MESCGDPNAEAALVKGLSKGKREKTLLELLEQYESRVIRFVNRFNVIEPHLDDYFSSLSPGAHTAVQNLKKHLALQLDHLQAIKIVIERRQRSAYSTLIYQLSALLKGMTSQSGLVVPEFHIQADWESKIELWLQRVGSELEKASSSSEFKLSRARARQATSVSLKMAGISPPK